MPKNVDIDKQSGFCGGVIRAINRAEKFVATDDIKQKTTLYSLGSIVHNEAELSRLENKGLLTISKEDLSKVEGKTVLIRAHGEPPETYQKAERLGLNLIDCTCPVVLRLQKRIKEAYQRFKDEGLNGKVLIFGKIGHAEVLGLMGQIGGDTIVIPNSKVLKEEIDKGNIDISNPIAIFSQTTKSPDEYNEICSILQEKMALQRKMSISDFLATEDLRIYNTVCSQVSSRHKDLQAFAKSHDIIIFVAGKESSNGKVLCDLCRTANSRTYHVSNSDEISFDWFKEDDNVGVCGATSTPKWLLEEVADKILKA